MLKKTHPELFEWSPLCKIYISLFWFHLSAYSQNKLQNLNSVFFFFSVGVGVGGGEGGARDKNGVRGDRFNSGYSLTFQSMF